MPVFVKICGLCSPGDVEAVAALRPDALGFVFWPGSRRCVTAAEVADWTSGISPGILKVGVFVDAMAQSVRAITRHAGLDIVQLHGHETPHECGVLGGRLWKAAHLDRDAEPAKSPYPVEAMLVDSAQGWMPGGTGVACDWDRARAYVASCGLPVVLAGGLVPDNVAEAIEQVGPWGVDVSSGVEQRPRVKDLGRVKAFIEACRNT